MKEKDHFASLFVQDLDLFSCLLLEVQINSEYLRNMTVLKVQELKSSLEELNLEVTDSTISDLSKEINELVEAGGKKFRPGLMFLMGKVFGLSLNDLKTYARAVELTHLASLIHDDVIDESPNRRNHPTLNALRNNTTAVLAGDYVLATIMGELAVANRNDLLIDLTQCIKDLADGEWLQFDLKSKEKVSFEDLELICIKKTGSLIRYCCTTPAKIAGYNDLSSMVVLGERIGLIFQMADDIVDGLNQSGRPPFQDITNGQLNYVSLKLMELYPDLKESVYALKSGKSHKIPWTNEQYFEAIRGIHELIDKEKKHLLGIFSHLCDEKGQEDLVEVFDFTLSKIQLNYATHLNFENNL
jgi:geranylgeranyl pyrophosphate synthase